MIKVDSKKAAWELANRLFPSDYAQDERGTKNAGYPIYKSTNPEMNAWISDLGDRLELNYPNGHSENIWIETSADIVAFVGMYFDETVFGEVKVRKVKEVVYHRVMGVVNKVLDDGRFGIEISFGNNDVASFGCENVAYVRLTDRE